MDYIIKTPQIIMNARRAIASNPHKEIDIFASHIKSIKLPAPKSTYDEWKRSTALSYDSITCNVLYRLPSEEGLIPIFKLLHFEPTKIAKNIIDNLPMGKATIE